MENCLDFEQVDPESYSLVSFDEGVDEKLRSSTYASYYLADAIECIGEDPGAVFAALKDIICANRNNFLIPVIALHFSIDYLSPDELEGISDFMSEELNPEQNASLASTGIFQTYRNLARDMRKHGRPPDNLELFITISTEPIPTPGMEEAKSALKRACVDIHDTNEFRAMKSVLQPAC